MINRIIGLYRRNNPLGAVRLRETIRPATIKMEYLYRRNTCSETFTLERYASGSEVEFLVGNWDGIFLLPCVPLQLEIRRTIAAYPRGKCASAPRVGSLLEPPHPLHFLTALPVLVKLVGRLGSVRAKQPSCPAVDEPASQPSLVLDLPPD